MAGHWGGRVAGWGAKTLSTSGLYLHPNDTDRMKLIRAALVASFAFSVAACDGILGSDDDNFTFGAQEITFEEGMTNEAEISALVRTIQVDGVLLLPHPCHT